MVLSCMIVDDEPLAVKLLESFVAQTPELELLGSFTDSVEAINAIKFGLLQTDNDSSLLYLLAYAYFVKGSHSEGLEALDQALDADFEMWPDFIEYDKELLANDVEIMELIEQHKRNQNPNATE